MLKAKSAVIPALIALALALGYWAGSHHQKEVELLFGKLWLSKISPTPLPTTPLSETLLHRHDESLSQVVYHFFYIFDNVTRKQLFKSLMVFL